MRIRQFIGLFAVGTVIALGCGDSGDTDTKGDGSAGSGASSGTGTGASSGTSGASGAGATDGGGGTSGTGTGGTGTGGTGTGGTGTGGTGTGGIGPDGSAGTGGQTGCVPITCQGKTYKCGNCIDDDGDGKIDMQDPDCLGPCHNAEDTYFGSIPGQEGPLCTIDCYFDQDSGAGNDQCYWNHKCDPLAVAPNYPPEGAPGNPNCPYDANAKTPGTGKSCTELYNQQLPACENFCGPLVPNGCDCFGCCELPAGGGKYVWLGSFDPNDKKKGTCSLKDAGDPTKCQPCTPVKACLNTCEKCELCLGKTTLPPECLPPPPDGGTGGSGTGGTGTGGTGTGGTGTGGTGTGGTGGSCGGQICPPGKQQCGLSCQPPCPLGQFCLTGCCTIVPT